MGNQNTAPGENRMRDIFFALLKFYGENDPEDVAAYLTDKSAYKTQWVLETLTGKTAIMDYMRGKSETMKKHHVRTCGSIVVFSDIPVLRIMQEDDEGSIAVIVSLDDDGMIERIDLCDFEWLLGEAEES